MFCIVWTRSSRERRGNCWTEWTEWTEWYLIERYSIKDVHPTERTIGIFLERVTWYPTICFVFHRGRGRPVPWARRMRIRFRKFRSEFRYWSLKLDVRPTACAQKQARPVSAAVSDFGMNWQRTWYISRGLFRTILALAIEGQCRNNGPHYLRKSTGRC